jgi:hypothetical protein
MLDHDPARPGARQARSVGLRSAVPAALLALALTGLASAQVERPPVRTRLIPPPEVNAPVAPEAIYVGSNGPGASAGIRVIDLNGFGQGTGDLATTRFLLNPNLGAPGVFPTLVAGTSSRDAGGAGALTLTRDTSGSDLLARGSGVQASFTEIHLGQPLDLVFNNANINVNAGNFNQRNPATGVVVPGNTISVAPHPNPPRLVTPSPNPTRGIDAEEPTVASSSGPPGSPTTMSPPCLPSPPNLLVQGNPLAPTASDVGVIGVNFPGVFFGPQPAPASPPPPVAFCPYSSRQQIGHFLYALDEGVQRVVILNSNRFRELGEFAVSEPVAMTISPNLERLAVAERGGDIVFFDIRPFSPTFHTEVARVATAAGEKALAWQPNGEDLLVTNQSTNSLTVIAGTTLGVRKVITGGPLVAPVDVVATSRQSARGFVTGVYFAFILNGDGTVAVFESGPDAIGYDDVVGLVQGAFPGAVTLQPDVAEPRSGCWVAHADATGRPAVSRVALTQSPAGPLQVPTGSTPNLRGRQWTTVSTIGLLGTGTLFSGAVIRDIAFDDTLNAGAFPDVISSVVPGIVQAPHSGKGHLKQDGAAQVVAEDPRLMFVATTDHVDVVDVATGTLIRSIDTPGVVSLSNYWRQ